MTDPVKGWSAYEKRSRTGYFPVSISDRRHIHRTVGTRPLKWLDDSVGL